MIAVPLPHNSEKDVAGIPPLSRDNADAAKLIFGVQVVAFPAIELEDPPSLACL